MHRLPYITVRIARLDFKSHLHIISYRLNPSITLSSTYCASRTHFTTPFTFATFSYTGCIRYIIFLSAIFYIEFWTINCITDCLVRHSFYLPKKSQPIKCNTSRLVHYTTDTPCWLFVAFQLPVTPIKKSQTKNAISLLILGRFSSYFGKLLPHNPST